MPVVWDERHRGHAPGAGIWLGVSVPGDEEPERGDVLGEALRAAGCDLTPATDHGDEPLLRVHTADFVAYLECARPPLGRGGSPRGSRSARRRAVRLRAAPAHIGPAAASPRRDPPVAGLYAMDTMTLISAGTYRRGAGRGRRRAHGLRPRPRRRAGRVRRGASTRASRRAPTSTAAPATSTTPRSRRSTCAIRGSHAVAIIDVDAHHGNGTQEIFYARDDVFYGSAHVDPADGWFPHFAGFADERGADAGNRRQSQPPAPARRGRRRMDRGRRRARSTRPRNIEPTRSSSRSASTEPPPIRTARSRSPPPGTRRSARGSRPSIARRFSCRKVATCSTRSAPLVLATAAAAASSGSG